MGQGVAENSIRAELIGGRWLMQFEEETFRHRGLWFPEIAGFLDIVHPGELDDPLGGDQPLRRHRRHRPRCSYHRLGEPGPQLGPDIASAASWVGASSSSALARGRLVEVMVIGLGRALPKWRSAWRARAAPC
jgi:hypothetical protein